jgi:hypothetical protein
LDIYYLSIPEELPQKEETVVKQVNKTFYLSKDVSYKHQHIRGSNKEIKKLGPVKTYTNIKAYKCSKFK